MRLLTLIFLVHLLRFWHWFSMSFHRAANWIGHSLCLAIEGKSEYFLRCCACGSKLVARFTCKWHDVDFHYRYNLWSINRIFECDWNMVNGFCVCRLLYTQSMLTIFPMESKAKRKKSWSENKWLWSGLWWIYRSNPKNSWLKFFHCSKKTLLFYDLKRKFCFGK